MSRPKIQTVIIEEYDGVLIAPEIVDDNHLLNKVNNGGAENLFVVPKSVWDRYQKAIQTIEELRKQIVAYPHPKLRVDIG